MDRLEQLSTTVVIAWLLSVLISVSLMIGAVYAAAHFISKWW